MKKSYEQLAEEIKKGTFTKKDAKEVAPYVHAFGPDALRARDITPIPEENRHESGSKIMLLLRKLILGQKSK